MNYRVHPWERAKDEPLFADRLAELLSEEERRRTPYGHALDVGTGSRVWAVELARRVTDLAASDVEPPFTLALDTGTFHGLRPDLQRAMGRELTASTTDDATILLLAWSRRLRPFIRGVDPDDIRASFPGWDVTDMGPSNLRLPPSAEAVLRPGERWYRLRRAASGA